ncbi:MAG TPA: class I SAM-dependent methyltransferase [Candidatus Dormibacteraeota bacterium]|nr:class I SAM-dependent methyltransferase [Candidatus Dormibacteraeota bacterium]
MTAADRDRLAGIFDRAAAVYDTVEPRFFRDIARGLVSRTRLDPGARVLDVATGPGVVLGEIGRAGPPGVCLVGVDISAGMVREARARLSAQGIPAHVLLMDAEHLGLADAGFDLVAMSRAYPLPQRRAMLSEVRRVLPPGAGCTGVPSCSTAAERGPRDADLARRSPACSRRGAKGVPPQPAIRIHVRAAKRQRY